MSRASRRLPASLLLRPPSSPSATSRPHSVQQHIQRDSFRYRYPLQSVNVLVNVSIKIGQDPAGVAAPPRLAIEAAKESPILRLDKQGRAKDFWPATENRVMLDTVQGPKQWYRKKFRRDQTRLVRSGVGMQFVVEPPRAEDKFRRGQRQRKTEGVEQLGP